MANVSPVRFDKPIAFRVDQDFLDAAEEIAILRGDSKLPRSEVIREAVLALRDKERAKAKRSEKAR